MLTKLFYLEELDRHLKLLQMHLHDFGGGRTVLPALNGDGFLNSYVILVRNRTGKCLAIEISDTQAVSPEELLKKITEQFPRLATEFKNPMPNPIPYDLLG